MLYLIVDLIDHLMICFQLEQMHFEVAGSLYIGQNQWIQIHGRLIARQRQHIVQFAEFLRRRRIIYKMTQYRIIRVQSSD